MTTPRPPEDLRLPRPNLDPTRHLLTRTRLDRQPDGTEALRPIPLDEAAADWRASVEAGRRHEKPGPPPAQGVVLLSANRVLVVAEMIQELALRLRPGLAVGPIQSDGSLSELARQLAEDIDQRTWL